jgi:hypothetical protein
LLQKIKEDMTHMELKFYLLQKLIPFVTQVQLTSVVSVMKDLIEAAD